MAENGLNGTGAPPDGEAPRTDDEMLVKESELEERTGPDAPPQPGGAESPHQPDGADESAESDEMNKKRSKRSSRKEMLDLINRKNEMLLERELALAKAAQDIENLKDRLLRLAAEFENYKKRTRREWELLQQKANADLIRDLLGGIDNFDRAFAALGPAEGQYQEGLRLIYDGLMEALRRAGLREIPAMGQAFNPNFHEAVGEIEGGEVEPGHVAQIVHKGYMLNDSLVRPARVLVERRKPD